MRSPILATILSAVLAACGGDGSHPGGPCGPNRECGSGEICDMTNPGGPICIDGSGDLDGDGIPNDKDFCEHMAGGAHDEDGDGIGDECDPCPIAKPPATPETDGDGVDSPCDPNPTTPGDKIVLFNSFTDPLPSSWTMTGNWMIQGGEAVMTPADTGTIAQLTVPITPSANLAIFTQYRVDQVTPGATNTDVAVTATSSLPMGDTTIICGSSRSGGGDLLQLQTGATSNSQVATSNLFDPASQYGILQQIDGGDVSCALVSAKYNDAVPGNTAGESMNKVGLYARGATARFSYILVVGQ